MTQDQVHAIQSVLTTIVHELTLRQLDAKSIDESVTIARNVLVKSFNELEGQAHVPACRVCGK